MIHTLVWSLLRILFVSPQELIEPNPPDLLFQYANQNGGTKEQWRLASAPLQRYWHVRRFMPAFHAAFNIFDRLLCGTVQFDFSMGLS